MIRAPAPMPMPCLTFDSQALLDAVDGLAYVADGAGCIVALGRPAWESFAEQGAGEPIFPGYNLFGAISDDETRGVYRRLYAQLLAGARGFVDFEYRCDAPDLRRTMRMAISVLQPAEGPPLLFHQSQVLSAVPRPWIALFEPERLASRYREELTLPLVRVCSFCHRVARPEGGGWTEPETYYAEGGARDVRISHGVCPGCVDRLR